MTENKESIKTLDSIESNQTKLLWYSNKHDGIPFYGLMLFNGEKCWYRTYTADINEFRASDESLLKSGHTKEQIESMSEDDREWYDEIYYYRIYKLSNIDLYNLEKGHTNFSDEHGTHCDYSDTYSIENKRNEEVDDLLDNFLTRYYKKITRYIMRNKNNLYNEPYENFHDGKDPYERDIIGHFKI